MPPALTAPVPVRASIRFRFNGLRKLNWVERSCRDYGEHLDACGFDRWMDPGPLAIVVGPNAGGKSTVIDLLRALGDARLWPSLARENYPGDDFSGFDIEGEGFVVSGRFSKYTPEAEDTFDKLTIFAVASCAGGGSQIQCLAPKYGGDSEWSVPLQALLDHSVGLSVFYYPPTGRHPADELDDDTLVGLLNELADQFPSVLANPIVKPFSRFRGAGDGAGRIGVLFKDDAGQHAFVHRSALPLGWLQLASVLAFLRGCAPESLILLDEPDRHLHPSLQRVLLELVARERAKLGAQVVLATHSSVLANPELCERASAKVVVVARGRCEQLADTRRVLDDLGVTSGDLVQANGVVWVEGPSDRIYLKTWLELYARNIGEPAPIERVHYAFVAYGGALIKHVALADAGNERVDLRAVNRNFSILIDRDLSVAEDGEFKGEKGRLLAEAQAIGLEPAVWITQDYTIENYLRSDWPWAVRHAVMDAGGRTRVRGIGKVELATRFANAGLDWPSSYRADTDLPDQVAALFARIKAWQSPQEVIETTYLPPFLLGDPPPFES